jgi:hypothetical protein
MHQYRAVVLILASINNEIYRNCRKVWKKYMNIDPTIKVYFVYGELDEPLFDYDDSSDLIFSDFKEHPYMIIEKTIRAMECIDSQVKYDFFIRTNLSTFWDFSKLQLQLNRLPTEKCYSGDGPLPRNPSGFFLSGADTIVTPDLVKSIVSNKQMVEYMEYEDVAMGKYFHGYLKTPMISIPMCFIEDATGANDFNKVMNRINLALTYNISHYRVKSMVNREQSDLYVYKILLKRIYNIDF